MILDQRTKTNNIVCRRVALNIKRRAESIAETRNAHKGEMHQAFRTKPGPLVGKTILPYMSLPFTFRFSSVYLWMNTWRSQHSGKVCGVTPFMLRQLEHTQRVWCVRRHPSGESSGRVQLIETSTLPFTPTFFFRFSFGTLVAFGAQEHFRLHFRFSSVFLPGCRLSTSCSPSFRLLFRFSSVFLPSMFLKIVGLPLWW